MVGGLPCGILHQSELASGDLRSVMGGVESPCPKRKVSPPKPFQEWYVIMLHSGGNALPSKSICPLIEPTDRIVWLPVFAQSKASGNWESRPFNKTCLCCLQFGIGWFPRAEESRSAPRRRDWGPSAELPCWLSLWKIGPCRPSPGSIPPAGIGTPGPTGVRAYAQQQRTMWSFPRR